MLHIAVAGRTPVDVDVAGIQIDDPDLSDTGTSIEWNLHRPVDVARRVRYFDEEQDIRSIRVSIAIEILA